MQHLGQYSPCPALKIAYCVCWAEQLEIGQLKCLVGKMLKLESLAELLIY